MTYGAKQMEKTREQPPSQRVVEAVAEADGVDPVDIEVPLFDVVDPEALDAVFGPTAEGQVKFSYHGYTVTVHADGRVDVCRPD